MTVQTDETPIVSESIEETAESIETLEPIEPVDDAALRLQRPVEALLFVASEPLSIKKLAAFLRAEETEIATTLQSIEADFTDRGIVLREVGGGYRFATSPLARDAVEAYLLPPKTTLSTPALEALAIVAHTQPVTKSEIEAIRGVNSDSVVNTLLDRNFIAEAGRKDVVGRPMQYKTTAFFLESFGLRSLDDLPELELEPGQPLELLLVQTQAEEAPPGEGQSEEPPLEEGLAAREEAEEA